MGKTKALKVMKKVTPKKVTKKKLRSMARTAKRVGLADWSKKVRERDQKCLICDRTDHLNGHHLLPKESYPELMFELENGVALCPTHHKFGKYSAHKNPIWFAKILQELRAEQFKWAVERV